MTSPSRAKSASPTSETEPQIAGQNPKRRFGNPAWVKGVSGNPAGRQIERERGARVTRG
jgi:hypothetical protein